MCLEQSVVHCQVQISKHYILLAVTHHMQVYNDRYKNINVGVVVPSCHLLKRKGKKTNQKTNRHFCFNDLGRFI